MSGAATPVRSLTARVRRELGGLIERDFGDELARRCLEIEFALLRSEFDGLPLGSTLTDQLSAFVYRSIRAGGLASAVRRKVAYRVQRFRGVEPARRIGRGSAVVPGGYILVALISQRYYHAAWVPALLRALEPASCHVVAPGIAFELPAGAEASGWHEMPAIPMRPWRRAFDRAAPGWRAELRRGRSIGLLTREAAAVLFQGLLASSFRIRRCRAFLEEKRPAAIVVEYDRNTRGSCLVLAARALGIPTLALVHGALNGPFGYTPVLADRVLCWGEIQRHQLMEYGAAGSRISVVGFERLYPTIHADRAAVRRRLGIADGDTFAVLATNPIRSSWRRKLATAFCEAVEGVEGVRGAIRPHPSEKLETYDSVRQSFPGVSFVSNDECSQGEILAAADLVVVRSSSFGSEAMAKGRPCAVLDVLDEPLGHGRDLVELGGAPKARSAGELARILARFRGDADFVQGLDESRQRFVPRMYAAFGEDAVANIAGVIQETVEATGVRIVHPEHRHGGGTS